VSQLTLNLPGASIRHRPGRDQELTVNLISDSYLFEPPGAGPGSWPARSAQGSVAVGIFCRARRVRKRATEWGVKMCRC